MGSKWRRGSGQGRKSRHTQLYSVSMDLPIVCQTLVRYRKGVEREKGIPLKQVARIPVIQSLDDVKRILS